MQRLPITEDDFRRFAKIASGLELFASLKGAELDPLLAHLQLVACEKGEILFKQGDAADALYIILEGEVTIHLKHRWLGLLRTVVVLREGILFGEIGLLERRARSATAVARTNTRLFVLLAQDFEVLLKHNPAFAGAIRWLSDRRQFELHHA